MIVLASALIINVLAAIFLAVSDGYLREGNRRARAVCRAVWLCATVLSLALAFHAGVDGR